MYKLVISFLCVTTVIIIYWEACILSQLEIHISNSQYSFENKSKRKETSADESVDWSFSNYSNSSNEDEQECRIPKLNPFDPKTMRIIRKMDAYEYKLEHNCTAKSQMKFMTDYEGNLMESDYFPNYIQTVNCCYFGFERGSNDMAIRYSERIPNTKEPICIPITSKITKIKSGYEFIGVKCINATNVIDYEDYFGIVRLKTEFNRRDFRNQDHDPLNIIILGLDSVSHMNFQRFMPKTRDFLVHNLSGFEFHGRNKVSESTFENVIPTLTGLFTEELSEKGKCWPSHDSYFDDCPLIWKKFKNELGYLTFYAEDSTHRSAFLDSTLNGFQNPPTDYDFRTLYRGMEIFEGNDGCFKHQYSVNILTELMIKTGVALRHQKYFQFLWLNTGNHDSAKSTIYDDQPVFEALKYLTENNLLNNSVFILMSDHGMTFGPYVQLEQGMLESRMPLLVMSFPQWFMRKYQDAMKNLKSNTQRLTTPFDSHETLLDLLNTESLKNIGIAKRKNKTRNRRGISLFLPIPKNRTCESAGIKDHWCICSSKIEISNPSSNPKVLRGVRHTLDKMNFKLRNLPECAKLTIKTIISARKIIPQSEKIQSKLMLKSLEKYDIIFQTIPSDGIFQVTIKSRGKQIKLGGPISRINAFKNQGDCILNKPEGNRELQQFCFCSS